MLLDPAVADRPGPVRVPLGHVLSESTRRRCASRRGRRAVGDGGTKGGGLGAQLGEVGSAALGLRRRTRRTGGQRLEGCGDQYAE